MLLTEVPVAEGLGRASTRSSPDEGRALRVLPPLAPEAFHLSAFQQSQHGAVPGIVGQVALAA